MGRDDSDKLLDALEDMEQRGIEIDEPHWLTKDGRALRVKEMTTTHIQNAMAMLKRNGFTSYKTFQAYASAGPEGDMAQLCFDQEQQEVLSKTPHSAIDWFHDELKRRGEIK